MCYRFDSPQDLQAIRIVFDSDLNRESLPRMERELNRNLFHNRLLSCEPSCVPPTMVKAYRVTAVREDGEHVVLIDETRNYHRLRVHPVQLSNCVRLEMTILETWGHETVRVFAFECV